ncbi:glycerophosphodiester phosphodiesterase family protein [Kocuria massiliensis]|uniref:glycerophosphodiester phosphodiesterase family protein n=1 Tax=Kocuria massiliensis TaxID=1926282 RepID=UPI0022B972EA|nr:glycerophosphodiester phosphodiesterase family protein [Kocuria massiliensis]
MKHVLRWGMAAALVVTALGAPSAEAQDHAGSCPDYHVMYDRFVHGLEGNDLGLAVQHRGAFSATLPGNSLGAFRASFEACQPAIETDVRTTRDGQLVLFHDTHVGLALEPTFDPERGTGPNPALSSLDYRDLERKPLLTKDRKPTSFEVPTLDQLLQTAENMHAPTLMHLDVKEPDQAVRIARTIADFESSHPDSHMSQRVVLKLPMSEYPTPGDWQAALDRAGVHRTIMVLPMMNPGVAAALDAFPGKGSVPRSQEALQAWTEAPSTLAPAVEVLIKDSSDVRSTKHVFSEFGDYQTPKSRDPGNAEPGSMAQMAFTVLASGKPLGNFVPLPDRMLWETRSFSGYTVPNIGGDHRPLNVTRAFYNADGRCCYALDDKRSTSKYAREAQDLRANIAWQADMGVRLFTVDDSDSVHTYLSENNILDRASVPSPRRAAAESRSWLYWQLQGMRIPNESRVTLKGWGGGASHTWQGQVCLFNWRDQPGWVAACWYDKESGYSPEMEISVVNDHFMRIKNVFDQQCLATHPGDWDLVYWQANCDDPRTLWSRTANDEYRDVDGRYLSFDWDDRYSWGVPWAYAHLTEQSTGSWSTWSFDV